MALACGRVRSAALALGLALAAADAHAQGRGGSSAADVEAAEQLYTKLDYEEANATAERVVRQRGLSHDQLVRAYRVLAITHAILGKDQEAKDAFLKLLASDPDYAVDPNLGPKVTTPFLEARGVFRTLPTKPGVSVTAKVRSDGGQLRVTTRDPQKAVKRVVVGYRWTSAGEFTTAPIAVGVGVPVEVSPAPAGRTRLDFFAQAFDDHDNAILEAGNPQVPKSAFADPAPGGGGGGGGEATSGGSVLSSPVFWILSAAVVAGGGTALFFALRPEAEPTRAVLTPQIECGQARCR